MDAFGVSYQNRSFIGPERNDNKHFVPQRTQNAIIPAPYARVMPTEKQERQKTFQQNSPEGKCISIRSGEHSGKNLVVRDYSGPAMQVVYYEIDSVLPELPLPCTIRVVGRMLSGSSRLQSFSVRAATADDVIALPRRVAVAAHHVTKLCHEYNA